MIKNDTHYEEERDTNKTECRRMCKTRVLRLTQGGSETVSLFYNLHVREEKSSTQTSVGATLLQHSPCTGNPWARAHRKCLISGGLEHLNGRVRCSCLRALARTAFTTSSMTLCACHFMESLVCRTCHPKARIAACLRRDTTVSFSPKPQYLVARVVWAKPCGIVLTAGQHSWRKIEHHTKWQGL